MSSYLTCTVAQAKEFNDKNPHNVISLNQLVDERAISHPDVVVAAFPELKESDASWDVVELSTSLFKQTLVHY